MVKEQFLEPYTAFEMAADELLAMIQESCDTLDGKIKEYVRIEKQEREAEITKYYQEAEWQKQGSPMICGHRSMTRNG